LIHHLFSAASPEFHPTFLTRTKNISSYPSGSVLRRRDELQNLFTIGVMMPSRKAEKQKSRKAEKGTDLFFSLYKINLSPF
jgi:hypothetical protein